MLWVKAFHILFVTSWFAGLFYLPRIFVNLAQETDSAATARLLGMARRLYRFMTILAVPAVLLGIWLWLEWFRGSGGWLHAKLLLVLVLMGYHHGCNRLLKKFEQGRNTRSHTFYRWFNEAPVLLLLLVLILVVVQPF